ncbi:MAG: hypothetical protein ACLPVF_10720 [Acidimicrobiales bacterium]
MTVLTATAMGGTASAASVPTGPVLKAAKTAIAKQTGVHVVFSARSDSSSTTVRITADVGVTSGDENVRAGTADLAVRVTPTYGYVKGNASGLTRLFGLTAADAKKVGTHWVAWKAGKSQYDNLKADVTFSAVTALLPKVKGTRLSTDTTKGATLYVLKWTVAPSGSTPKLSNTLTLSALTGLPVNQTSTARGGTRATTGLSDWGEPILVSAPPAASTIASSKISG